ncbi:Type I restriction-modification system DNA methyltransferase subunit [Pseudomonas coronafaciens pv. zizaniae]|uniref:type I restriction-modification system subunit M n=1 Tax=Pseudomonas coronafaciens TaxID=53409 RepID=UPI000EFE2DCD|nr:type I restriction-modification system subunit M [Pseudomonas coronafaciens]RMN24070.1 Type I restriction-modification system DNA methyltransferase subunit [Pseudomonas coronafaciens pv. zizaniae]
MDYQELKQLEDDLWEAADQLRANSKLTASEYSMPVLGLIFLRHATTRFYALLEEVQSSIPARATGHLREDRIKLGFQGKAAIYLPEIARYEYLASLPASENIAAAIHEAMQAIEDSVTDQDGNKLLAGALPKNYHGLERDLLPDLIKIFNRPALQNASGDVFGRIYEYFLNQFAQSGAQEGGEFFTPPSLVRMIVNVIEPDHGTVLDPACGSAGMFVQTGHFMEDVRHKLTHDADITFYGQEKAEVNSKLARLNLAVHGLEGKILLGNTFYEDQHQLVGQCDFVMANPPFNVDGVQVAKIKSQIGTPEDNPPKRLPFGLPGTAGKSRGKDSTETISNGNSLWIQYFYSYLNATGRAGFVMAASASDAGNKDRDIRQQLVETGHVDVMMSIGPKFFYTRSLPCTLWFYDKSKPKERLDGVLMIDARNVYTVVSARSHVFTEEQLSNLSAITWLYRGQTERFVELLGHYHQQLAEHLQQLPERISADNQQISLLEKALSDLAEATLESTAVAIARTKMGEGHGLTDELMASFRAELQQVQMQSQAWQQLIDSALAGAKPLLDELLASANLAARQTAQGKAEAINATLKAGFAALEARNKAWLKLLDMADKQLRSRQWASTAYTFDHDNCREAKQALLHRDVKKREKPTVRDLVVEAFKRAGYFIAQGHWLLSRFPDGVYADVLGLCAVVSRATIAVNDYSLTPGRYVGVALGVEDDDEGEAFRERMKEIHVELAEFNDRAVGLVDQISRTFESLLV